MTIATSDSAFDWKRWPEAEALVNGRVEAALEGNMFAAELARRMRAETSTRFHDWIDHLALSERPGLRKQLAALGFAVESANIAVGATVFGHEGGMFPRLLLARGDGPEVRE